MRSGFTESQWVTGMVAVPLIISVAEELDSWQIAVVAFGFVIGILVIGLLVEKWGMNLHA